MKFNSIFFYLYFLNQIALIEDVGRAFPACSKTENFGKTNYTH